jgi:antitoxin ParD1/3/4
MSQEQKRDLAKFCHRRYCRGMSTMNISLPDSLKTYVDEQVAGRGFGTSSEYVRELIRRDQDRQNLRTLLLEGAGSASAAPADKVFFDSLRSRARQGDSG